MCSKSSSATSMRFSIVISFLQEIKKVVKTNKIKRIFFMTFPLKKKVYVIIKKGSLNKKITKKITKVHTLIAKILNFLRFFIMISYYTYNN